MHPEYPDSHPSDRPVAADILLRQEPNEEEDEDDGTEHDEMMTMTKTTKATRSERAGPITSCPLS